MSELVSVIVPVFRVEDYLRKCVDSIIAQTYTNLEIILVDDGSDDGCPKICDEYSKRDNRIVVIHKRNGGLSDARNAGIRNAKGRYITFIDSDDYIERDYVSTLVDILTKYNADMSVCNYTAVYSNGKKITNASNYEELLTPKDALAEMLYQKKFNAAAVAKLYKTELFHGIKYPKGELFEDTSTTHKLIMVSTNGIACKYVSKYNYIIRPNSIMTSGFAKKNLQLIQSIDNMSDDIIKKYPELVEPTIRAKVYSRLSVLRQMTKLKNRDRDKNLEKLIRSEILLHASKELKDKRTPSRDKIAIMSLCFGVNSFRWSWKIYKNLTRRCD